MHCKYADPKSSWWGWGKRWWWGDKILFLNKKGRGEARGMLQSTADIKWLKKKVSWMCAWKNLLASSRVAYMAGMLIVKICNVAFLVSTRAAFNKRSHLSLFFSPPPPIFFLIPCISKPRIQYTFRNQISRMWEGGLYRIKELELSWCVPSGTQ